MPRPPQPPIKRPVSTNASRPGDNLSKPVARLGINGGSVTTIGVKRKAEEELSIDQGIRKPVAGTTGTTKPIPYAGTMSKPLSSLTSSTQRPRSADGPPSKRIAIAPGPVASVKAPPKGSYAEIIARAKAAQQERGGQQVGMIKHQKDQRDKVSYLSQRKSGNEDIKAKAHKLDKLKNSPVLNGRIEKRARSSSPLKRPGSSSKIEKPARERAPRPAYNGTMRMPPSKPRDKPKPARRQDEYLGTDDEDDSELVDDIEEEDFGSDVSSDDMEAGAFDIDEEEAAAARAARMEDARELAEEKRLKAEKEARKRKLEALSRKAPPKKY